MKKNYIKIAALVMLVTACLSCKKNFLGEKPFSAYTPLTLTDSLGVEASLIGLYQFQTGILTYSNNQGWPSVWQVGTDVANATANQEGIEVPYYNYLTLTNTDNAATYLWGKEYGLINEANVIIDAVEGPNVTGLSAAG